MQPFFSGRATNNSNQLIFDLDIIIIFIIVLSTERERKKLKFSVALSLVLVMEMIMSALNKNRLRFMKQVSLGHTTMSPSMTLLVMVTPPLVIVTL